MPADTFLVIDDEPQIRRVLRRALGAEGARVIEAATAAAGVDAAAAHQPSLVVLDLGLPDGAGVDVCREIRRWSAVPIIVLSARYADEEKIALLDAGADDYVTKPFNPEELVARVRAQLRRARVGASPAPGPIQLDGVTADLVARTITRDGEPVHLTKTEWELFRVLLTHAGRTMTHRQLFAEVWGAGGAGDAQQYLRVYVANLRRKLEADPVRPRLIVTEPGVGYRLDRPR